MMISRTGDECKVTMMEYCRSGEAEVMFRASRSCDDEKE